MQPRLQPNGTQSINIIVNACHKFSSVWEYSRLKSMVATRLLLCEVHLQKLKFSFLCFRRANFFDQQRWPIWLSNEVLIGGLCVRPQSFTFLHQQQKLIEDRSILHLFLLSAVLIHDSFHIFISILESKSNKGTAMLMFWAFGGRELNQVWSTGTELKIDVQNGPRKGYRFFWRERSPSIARSWAGSGK